MEAQLWLCEYTLGVMEAGERGVGAGGGGGSAVRGLARAVEPENGLKASLGGAEKLVQGPSSEGYYSFEFPTRDASKSLDFGN